MSQLLDIDVNAKLVALMEAHNMEVGQTDDYFFVDGQFPGIVAQAFEMERFEDSVVVQIDITMLFPHDSFVESFVAHAKTVDDAVENIFQQFEANVFHTFIMAFWGKAKRVENGVGSDIWEINGHKWEAIVSNYGYRGYDEFDTIIPEIDAVYDTIKSSIEAYPVEKDIYAIRTVFTNTSTGEQVTEALINNQEFPELHEKVATLPWNPSEQYYSVRNLVLLMKLREDAEEKMEKNEIQL
jgi:L-fucose mutarotase/ribose pyranase (RbsD/FucU family)